MMQSLLLTGVTNAKNDDLKAHKSNETVRSEIDADTEAAVVKENKKFATVMKESLDLSDDKKHAKGPFIKGMLTSEAALAGNVKAEGSSTEQAIVLMTENEERTVKIETTLQNESVDNESADAENELVANVSKDETLKLAGNNIAKDETLKLAGIDVAKDEVLIERNQLVFEEELGALNKGDAKYLNLEGQEKSEQSAVSSEVTLLTTDAVSPIAHDVTFSKELVDKLPSLSHPTEHQKMPIDTIQDSLEGELELASTGPSLKSSEIGAVEQESETQQQLLSDIEAAQQFNTTIKHKINENVEAPKAELVVASEESEIIDSSELLFSKSDIASEPINLNGNIKAENIDSNVNGELNITKESGTGITEAIVTMNSSNEASEKEKIKATKETVLDSFINTNENNKKQAAVASDKANLSMANKVDGFDDSAESHDEFVGEKLESVNKSTEANHGLPVMLRNESSAASQPVIDVNGSRPNQMSLAQLDKSIAVNQQAQATNNLLQQPLDIQSKQAASMMGDRVLMMISQGKQEVQIRLDPAELGSMLIKVQVQQDQVQLNIQTQAGLSKDIIEQNMPRLREQLAQQGIQLGEANVQQQSQDQGKNQRSMETSDTLGRGMNNEKLMEDEQMADWIPSKIPSTDQGIDYYA